MSTITAQAEWYVGAYGGLNNPGAFSNVTVSDPTLSGGVSNARINDLELKSGLVGGVKGGYFFVARPWLGIETDAYTLKPDIKQQTIVGGTSSGRVFADSIQTTPLRLTTWTANIIIRSPSMFQPYGGMGYGLFFATSTPKWNIECPYQSWIQSFCRRPVHLNAEMGALWGIQVQSRDDPV